MKTWITICSIASLFPLLAFGQFELYLTGGYRFDNVRFSPSISPSSSFTSCCSEFTSANSTEGGFGGIFTAVDLQPLSLHISGGVRFTPFTLSNDFATTVNSNNEAVPAVFRQTANIVYLSVPVAIEVRYVFHDDFYFVVTPKANILVLKNFTYEETIVEPIAGVFESGERVRNQSEGSFTEAKSYSPELSFGVGKRFGKVYRFKGFNLDLQYSIGIGSLVTSENWSAQSLSLRALILL